MLCVHVLTMYSLPLPYFANTTLLRYKVKVCKITNEWRDSFGACDLVCM